MLALYKVHRSPANNDTYLLFSLLQISNVYSNIILRKIVKYLGNNILIRIII